MSRDKEQCTRVGEGKEREGRFSLIHPCPLKNLLADITSQAITRKIIYAMHIEITVHLSCNKVTSASWPKLAPIPHWMWIQFHDFLLTCDVPGRGGRGGVSTKFYTGRLCPEVQTLILLYPIFSRKRYLFRVPSIDNWSSFHKPSLELCILLTAVNALSLKYLINQKTRTFP